MKILKIYMRHISNKKVLNAFRFQKRLQTLQMLLDFKEDYKLYKCIYISKKNIKVTNAFGFQRRIQMLLDFKEEC